jgi:hypothetical protein
MSVAYCHYASMFYHLTLEKLSILISLDVI